MFHEAQVQSYKKITASADLKERVMDACENTNKTPYRTSRRIVYGLAPLAACLILAVLLLRTGEPLALTVGDTALCSEDVALPHVAEPVACGMRSMSLETPQYTVTLCGNQEMEVLSVDGLAETDAEGSIIWTVDVPGEDKVYKLTLLAEKDTYEVFLRYNVMTGTFYISYEAQ